MRKHLFLLAVALIAAFCAAPNVSAQVKEYKLNESFDALSSGLPAGWDASQGTTTATSNRWQSHQSGYNNTRGLRFDSYNNPNGNTNILLTPALDLTVGEWILTFRYKNPSGGPFSVFVSTDNGVSYLNNAVGQNLPNTDDWVQMTYSITALAAHSSTARIAFKGESNYGSGDAYIYLDDVTVESAPTCKSPEAIMAMGVTQTQATIFWNLSQDGAIPASYFITVTDGAGNTVLNNQSITAPNLTYTLTGLTAGTTYNVRLQGDCSSAFQGSSVSNNFTFATLCQPQNAPFSSTFDGLTDLPGCSYTKNAQYSTTYTYGSQGQSLALTTTVGSEAYIIFPELNLAANNAELTFFIRPETVANGAQQFLVALVNDPFDLSDIDILLQDSLTTQQWREVRVNSANCYDPTRTTARLMIAVSSGIDQSTFVDNVSIHTIPTCIRPEGFRVSHVSATTADFSWTTTNATQARITAITGTDTTYYTATSNPYTVTGLTPNSDYIFYIRGLCSATDSSELNPYPVEAHTLCLTAQQAEFTEGFEQITQTGRAPECWQMGWYNRPASVTSATPFTSSTTQKHSGARSMQLVSMPAGTRSYLATQCLPIDQANKYIVRFWMKRGTTGSDDDGFKVWVNTTPDDTVGGTCIGYVHSNIRNLPIEPREGWYEYEYLIPRQGNLYVMFEGISSGAAMFLDDISVAQAPACIRPKGVVVGNATASTVDITWQAGRSETSWSVNYAVLNVTGDTLVENTVTTTAPNYTITGLNSSSTYTITGSVAAECSAGVLSDPRTFSYSVDMTCTQITTLPYNEGFEDTRFPPICWQNVQLSTTSSSTSLWSRSTNSQYIAQGSGAAYRNYVQSGSMPGLVSPEIVLPAGTPAEVRFAVYRGTGYQSYTDEGIMVYVGTNDADTTGNTLIGFIPQCIFNPPVENAKGIYYYSFPIPQNITGANHVLFGFQGRGGDAMAIDDITVRAIPSCADMRFNATDVTSTTARIVLVSDSVACNWQISYGPEGTTAGRGTIVNCTAETEHTLTGLSPETVYDIYVRRDCGTEQGDWSLMRSIKTLCAPAALPIVDDFEDYATNLALQDASCYSVNYSGTSSYIIRAFANTGTGNSEYNHTEEGSQGLVFAYGVTSTYPGTSKGIYDVTRMVHLEADKNYAISIYAKAYYYSYNPGYYDYDLSFVYGTSSNALNVISTHRVNNNDFEQLISYFNVPADGDYIVGFRTEQVNNSFYLIVDDYSVREVPCIPPTSTLVTTLTSNSATINLTSGASQWEIAVSTSPIDILGTVTGDAYSNNNITSTTVNLTGLSVNTLYYYTVRSICNGAASDWMQPQTFRTRCTAITPPYSTSFDNLSTTTCWTAAGAGSIAHTMTEGNAAPGAMELSQVVAVSPEINVTSLNGYMISGMVKSATDSLRMDYGIMLDPDDNTTYEPLNAFLITPANTWVEFTAYFDALGTEDYEDYAGARYIAFATGQNTVYIDDLTIEAVPTCPKPSNGRITVTMPRQLTVDWTDNAGASAWLLRVVSADGVETIVPATAHPAVISGLQPATQYVIYVASVCSATDTSAWSQVGQIATDCDFVTDDYSESFSSMTTNTTPLCWDISGSQGSSNAGYIFGVYDASGNKCLRMHNYNLTPGTYEIRTPEFVLQQGKNYTFEFDLAHQASCGNLTLEVARRGTAGRTTISAYANNSSSTSYSAVGDWQHISIDASAYAGDTISFYFSATGDYGMGAIFLDNFSMMEVLSCSDISNLALTGVGEHTATVTFADTCQAHTQWEYVVVPRGTAVTDGTAQVTTTKTINITGLTTATAYDLYVRSFCGAGDYGHRFKLQFSTTTAPATMPYICDFSDNTENSRWTMPITMGANSFIVGQDAQAVLSGGNALYVSGNAVTWAYNTTPSLCYATRTVEFGTGEYNVELDWACTGGYSTFDFARFYLVPAYVDYRTSSSANVESATYTTFAWPNNAIAIDGGQMINKKFGWQHTNTLVDMTGREGVYNIVFVWRNINSTGSAQQAPLAVDNIAIRPATCADVDNIALSDITLTSATASFANPDGDLIRYVVSTSNVTADSVLSGTTTSASVVLTGLNAGTVYNFIARRECSATDISAWAVQEFQTECAPKAFPITEDFEGPRFPSVCWQEATLAPGHDYYGEQDGHWTRYPSNGYSSSNIRGEASASLSQGMGASAMLISPEFTLEADRDYHYSFWRSVATSLNYASDYYDVYINQTPDMNGARLVGSFSAYSTATGLELTDVDLPAGLAGNYYAILVGRVAEDYGHYLYVDDITIDRYPLCRDVAKPIVEAVTATTATVSVAMHGQSSVEFGVAPYSSTVTPQAITQTVSSTTGRAQFTGLTAGTSYAFFARAICTFSGDTTDWTLASRGVTKADDCFAPESLKVINLSDTNLTICWNDIPNATTCVYEIVGSQIAGTTVTDTAVINGLTARTAYTFRVAGLCGTDTTAWTTYSFRTVGTPAELPYATGFEQTTDNAAWDNVSSAQYSNFLVGGTDASGRSAGQRGLYITADGSTYGHEIPGLDAAGYDDVYNVVYAVRTLHFAHPGTYMVNFDWKCDAAGASSYYYKAYGRSFIAPADVQYTADRATGATISPAGSIDLIGQMKNTPDWTSFNRFITITEPGYRNLVFEFYNYNLYGYASESEKRNVPLAVDNVSVEEITCMPVTSMSLLSVRDTAAQVVVAKNDAVDLEYVFTTEASADSITAWQTLTSSSINDTLTFNGLAASTTYYLFARQACSAQDKSPWLRFTVNTTVVPASLPYVCGFETTAENNNWLYSQEGQTNHFIIGSNTSNGGQKSLYITSDGSTFGYDINTGGSAYAFRTFYLEPGVYSYSFEWTCQGDTYGYDYGRAFLAPASEVLVGGTTSTSKMVPRTAIQLDGGQLKGNTAWLTRSGIFTITEANSYNLAFLWYSNDYNGTTPLAVDNVELIRMACAMPQVAVSNITETSADVTFSGIALDADVVYGISAAGSFADATGLDTIAYAGPTATRTINGLSASSRYTIVARALCSDDEQSAVVATPFSTVCGVVTNFPFVENFETMQAEEFTRYNTPSNSNDIVNYCWLVGTQEPEGCVTTVTNSQEARISGNNTFIIDNYGGSTPSVQTVVALPLMDSIANLSLSFMYQTFQSAPAEVGYLTSATNTGTFVSLATLPSSDNGPAQYSLQLSAAPATARRIALRYTGYYYFMLDDIRVTRTVNAPAYTDTICFESDYTAHGFNVPNVQIAVGANTFNRVYSSVNADECDTIFTANVYRRAKAESVLYDTVCEGSAYQNGLWNIPAAQVASQRYFNVFHGASVTGCDSTQTLFLTVMPSQTTITDTICAGSSYQFGDQTLTQTGFYTRQYQSPYGCSVTENLSLYVLPDTIRQSVTICENQTPYIWNGRSLTASGVYHASIQGPRGCTQTDELRLTVIATDSVITAHFCHGGSVMVVDTFVTTAGQFNLVRVSAEGCDITYHVTVTEDPVLTGTASDYVCEGQLYYGNGINGLAVTADTVVTVTTKTAQMCDSVTNLTIHYVPTVYTSFDVTIAEGQTYTWNDQTYNATGQYTETLSSSLGCDSVVTLNLTVTTGVDDIRTNGRMKIVPNPARRGAQTLVFTEQTGRITTVEIINSFGATIDRREPKSTPIDITAPQAAGVYHVRITTADGRVYVEKLIVE